jgi:hypothetical protein
VVEHTAKKNLKVPIDYPDPVVICQRYCGRRNGMHPMISFNGGRPEQYRTYSPRVKAANDW